MSDILSRVRALLAQAEHQGTDPTEADAYQKRAEALMFQYRIERSMLSEEQGNPALREKPTHKRLDLCVHGMELAEELSILSETIARHCDCKTVLLSRPGIDVTDVFGYGPDIEYFEIMYTNILLHMSSVFFPKPDDGKSLGENLLELRSLGMNWLQMAEVYGWRKTNYKTEKYELWQHKDTGEKKTNWQLGGFYKRTTHAAAREKGIALEIISSARSRQAASESFRRSAASGYIDRVGIRLKELRDSRDGSGVARGGYFQAIDDLMASTYPNLKYAEKSEFSINTRAYWAGSHHGDSADISGSARMQPGEEKTAVE